MTDAEATFTLVVSETELTLIVTSLAYNENRQLYLANLAQTHGREKEALARRESAEVTSKLSERLYAVAAKEAR